MTFNPIFPAAIVVAITLALVGWCVWGLVRARRGGRLNWWLRIAVALLIGVACLRPGVGTQSVQTAQSEVDVLFVIDTTASMNAEDWNGAPRLEGVKQDVAALATAHAGARFALVTFDSVAVQRLPFTSDATALQSAVDTLRPEITTYSSGSSVTIAHTLVRRVLAAAAEQNPERARLVYYLGDGEQTSDATLESFASSADELAGGAVLGYGTSEGGPMRETLGRFDGSTPGYILDASGGTALSRIDEANLTAIAGQFGVPYEHRTPDAALEPASVDPAALETDAGADVETAFDLYWIFAIAAFVLLLREVWVTVRGASELRAARGVPSDDDAR